LKCIRKIRTRWHKNQVGIAFRLCCKKKTMEKLQQNMSFITWIRYFSLRYSTFLFLLFKLNKYYNKKREKIWFEKRQVHFLSILKFHIKGIFCVIGKKINFFFFFHILVIWDLKNENDLEITCYQPCNCRRNFKHVFSETTFFKSGVYFSHKLMNRSICNFTHI